VLEHRVLRKIFGLMREEVTGGWRIYNNEELHDLFSSLSVSGVIKSRKMGWAGHVVHIHGVGRETCRKEITWKA